MKVAIDIGHANGTGARGNGYEEHALCAVLGRYVQKMLGVYGIKADIIDDPELDNRHDLTRAVDRINAGGYKLGVSLHMDAAAGGYAHGAHVCYVSQKGGILAAHIAYRLAELMPGRADRTQLRKDLYILKRTYPPMVLCECGFITHCENADMVANHPQCVAEAIARGIWEYLTTDN